MADNDADEASKQAFVSQADRPEVRLRSDTPVNELTVRDLATLLAQVGQTRKDFWDGKDWIKDDVEGPAKGWKEYQKEGKEKPEKVEKNEKWEKNEKLEGKEIIKAEKNELDGVFEPGRPQGPDPRLDQVIQALSGLTVRVAQLTNQVEELRKADKG